MHLILNKGSLDENAQDKISEQEKNDTRWNIHTENKETEAQSDATYGKHTMMTTNETIKRIW